MTTRRIGLKHVEAFRTVMQAGSMTEAARRLHTSQPQISRLVSQLEAIVRFALFERSGTRLLPTLDGKRFFEDVEKTFVGLAGLDAAAANIRSFGGDRLSVAAMPRLAGGLLTRAVAQFKREHPDTLVTIRSGGAAAVDSWVSSGLCDVGLAVLYGEAPGLRVETLLTMDCVAVLPKGHRLTRLQRVQASDLEGEAFISFPVGSVPRERMDQVLAAAGAKPRTAVESDLGASVCALVAAGLGVSLINPLAALEEHRISDVELRPFTPSVPVSLAFLFPPHASASRLVTAFTDHARRVIAPELAVIASLTAG
ncbi:MAG: transcriptional regulator, LysR family [Ramlibacter sp.]|nr:transcriptional regulator, LysR family [Ramlibacter sp.]